MQPRGRGRIVNIASLQSEVSRPGCAAYAATKGALKMLTRGMCADLAASGDLRQRHRARLLRDEGTSALVADDEFSAWVRAAPPPAVGAGWRTWSAP